MGPNLQGAPRLSPASRPVPVRAPMKPALLAVGSALLAGALFHFTGHPLDPADYVVILLGVTLLAWTFEQYHPTSRSGH